MVKRTTDTQRLGLCPCYLAFEPESLVLRRPRIARSAPESKVNAITPDPGSISGEVWRILLVVVGPAAKATPDNPRINNIVAKILLIAGLYQKGARKSTPTSTSTYW